MNPAAAFVDRRARLVRERAGDGGLETSRALTLALDAALVELADTLRGGPIAVYAIGGYGRSEQCIWSDVDVLLLHTGGDVELATRAVLYPLWDANLKVGHAVRTIAECASVGAEDFETLTSLLSARFVAGDAALAEPFESMLVKLVRGRPMAQQLVARERERRRLEPFPVMAADVKSGRGGLRTLQGLWWQRRRAELIGLPVPHATAAEEAARSTLLRVRNGLHAAAGRSADRFVVDLREPAAHWLGTSVEVLAEELVSALQTTERLADEAWPGLHAESDPLVRFGRRVVRRLRPGPSAERGDGPLAIAAAAASDPAGVRFSDADVEAMRSAEVRWTGSEREALLELLAAGQRGRTAFGMLERAGWVDRAFPEWTPVSALPQLAPFHEHPVDAHLWRTVVEMLALLEDDDPVVSRTVAELGADDELVLSAFLHDIGKGRGADHSIVGAELATDFLSRAGFGPATVRSVASAIRHHLLLPETAMRRDIQDREIVADVATRAGDLRSVQLLYLLTIADSRATGATVWTSWKSVLVGRLYARLASHLGPPMEAPHVPLILSTPDADDAKRHVAAMPPEYAETAAATVARHLEAIAALDGPVHLEGAPHDVVVVGRDERGFFRAVTAAFAAKGIGVRSARLWTRADGVVVDQFEVADDRTGEPISAERWRAVQASLHGLLEGSGDIPRRVRERSRAYGHPRGDVQVRAHQETSPRHTVIEVRAPDRVGLLADIAAALHAEGLDLHFAVLDTRAGDAIDVFHVRRLGVPLVVDGEIEAMCRRIRDRLSVR